MFHAQPLAQSALDELWDFNDPAASEQRFERARSEAVSPIHEAELATQQARAVGLQGRFDEAGQLLDSITASAPVIAVRLLLERGRLLNSSGRQEAAVPLFSEAADRAQAAGLTFLAIDALHMIALADPTSSEGLTRQALSLVDATEDRRTKRWAVALHNNRGWVLHDEHRYDDALVEFENAHRASLTYGTAEQGYFTRWATARCLRSLGRLEEALAIQEKLAQEDPTDDDVNEEMQILRAALTRPA